MKMKGLMTTAMLFVASVANAQVMWSLKAGAMPVTVHEDMDYDKDATVKKTDWMAEFGLEIPLSRTWNIETGIRYRTKSFVAYKDEHVEERNWNSDWTDTYVTDEYDVRHYHTYLNASLLEVPIKATYKLQLNNDFCLHIGCGPYAAINLTGKPFDAGHDFKSSALSVGVEPSANLYYKNVSIGIIYNNPLIFQRHKDMDSNQFMFTLGFRFGSKVWNSIGRGIDRFYESGAADILASTLDQTAQTLSGGEYEGTAPVAPSTSTHPSDSKSRTSSSKTETPYNLGEQQVYNTEKRTYERLESQAIQWMTGGTPHTFAEQKNVGEQMKQIRTKWVARGKRWQNHTTEDACFKVCKYCTTNSNGQIRVN